MVRLVTRGDDAGSSVAANRAVELCASGGALKNASIIACGPALGDAAARLSGIPDLCIGLHLTLASEWDALTWPALTRHPLLTDARGCLPQSPALLPHTEEAIAAMIAEADAQLAALRNAGISPFYLDEHMATSAWAVPALKSPLAAWAEKNALFWPELAPVPGEGPLLERLRACPPGDYLHVNHPCLSEGDALLMGNADDSLNEVLAERAADTQLWTDLAGDAPPGVAFVSWREILTAA